MSSLAPAVAELQSASGRLAATFIPRAGMLGWSLRVRGEEVLGHPVSLEEYVARGEPTAIALLHPWANRLSSPEYEIAGRRVRLDLGAPNVHLDPNGDRTFDDAFDGLADPPDFVVAGAGLSLAVRFLEGYRFAQVYAPPGADFISFEPMTAPIDPFRSPLTLLAQPGSPYRARFDIVVAGDR